MNSLLLALVFLAQPVAAPGAAEPAGAPDGGPVAEPAAPEDQALAQARAAFSSGDLDGAVAKLEALLAARPDQRDARLLLGRVLLAQKKYQHALNAFSAILLKDANDPQACSGRALALEGLGDVPKAITWAKKATELAPDDLQAWYVLGDIYLNEQYLDAPRAEATFRQALVLAPGDRTAKLQLARALSYEKKVDQAIDVLESLAAERPRDWEVQYKLAESYYAVRKLTQAEQVLEKILAAEPGNAQAARLLEAVQSRFSYLLWTPLGALVLLPLLFLLFKRIKRGKTPQA